MTTQPALLNVLTNPTGHWVALVQARLDAGRQLWEALSHQDTPDADAWWRRVHHLDTLLDGWTGYDTYHDLVLAPLEIERAHVPGLSWPVDQQLVPCQRCSVPPAVAHAARVMPGSSVALTLQPVAWAVGR